MTGISLMKDSDFENAVLKLIEYGCSKVIITLGSKGAICADSTQRKPIFIKSKKVKAVDTTVSFK